MISTARKIPPIIPSTILTVDSTGFGVGLPQCGQACALVLTSLPQSGHGLIIAARSRCMFLTTKKSPDNPGHSTGNDWADDNPDVFGLIRSEKEC